MLSIAAYEKKNVINIGSTIVKFINLPFFCTQRRNEKKCYKKRLQEASSKKKKKKKK